MTFLLINRFVILETIVGLLPVFIVLFQNKLLKYLLTVDLSTPVSLAILYADVGSVNACLRLFTFSFGSHLGMWFMIR
jgi:hypothetical protein